MKKDEGMGIVFNAPVTVGTFVKVESGATYIKNKFENVENFHEAKEDCIDADEKPEIIENLSSFFYGNKEEAARFLDKIRGKKATEVVAAVNALLVKKTISGFSCKKPLWEVLTRYGLYNRSLSNWNEQIKI